MAQEPVLPGSFLRARAIGLMPMIDQVNDPFISLICLQLSRFNKSNVFILQIILSLKADANLCIYAVGRKGWQNHSSMCRWPWIPPLYRHQGDSPTPSGWNSPILRGLYPPKCFNIRFQTRFMKTFLSVFLYSYTTHSAFPLTSLQLKRQEERKQESRCGRLPASRSCRWCH